MWLSAFQRLSCHGGVRMSRCRAHVHYIRQLRLSSQQVVEGRVALSARDHRLEAFARAFIGVDGSDHPSEARPPRHRFRVLPTHSACTSDRYLEW
jgi:hypothetical protein